MKRNWTMLFALAVVSTLLVTAGCARNNDETVGTSTDSTLSLGDFPEATSPNPDPGLALDPAPTPGSGAAAPRAAAHLAPAHEPDPAPGADAGRHDR